MDEYQAGAEIQLFFHVHQHLFEPIWCGRLGEEAGDGGEIASGEGGMGTTAEEGKGRSGEEIRACCEGRVGLGKERSIGINI